MGLRGLTDRVAVVVGGATGIGAATAARLGEEGCRVVIGDIAADAARQTAEPLSIPGWYSKDRCTARLLPMSWARRVPSSSPRDTRIIGAG